MSAQAAENSAKANATEPRAVAARYDRESDRIVVILQNGWEFGFKPWLAQGLEDATPEQLAKVEILPRGVALHWEDLDADLGIDELLAGRYGSRAHMARVTARLLGAKGGRPRKAKAQEFAAEPDRHP